MNHTLDAKNITIGRVASKAAMILMGKNSPSYKSNAVAEVKVTIINASKAKIDEKKKEQKTYHEYSGYPGGLRTLTMKQVIERKGKGIPKLFEDAIYGMLPPNKLRAKMMKNLIITE